MSAPLDRNLRLRTNEIVTTLERLALIARLDARTAERHDETSLYGLLAYLSTALQRHADELDAAIRDRTNGENGIWTDATGDIVYPEPRSVYSGMD